MKATRSFILTATDFSMHAADAANVAAKLALRRAEKLLLVHATDVTNEKVVAGLRRRLDRDALALRESGADVEPVLVQGRRPSEALLAFIRERMPGLVVVSRAVKGPVDRWALGSFSEKIAEGSPAPTLVVRNPAVFETWDWTKARLKILLALDFSASSDVVLRWAKQMQRVGPCDFVACHVNWRVPTMEEATPPGTLRNPDAVQDRLERNLRKKVRDQLGEDSVPVVVRPNFGDAGPVVVEIAGETQAHVIAVGAHQRHGIHRFAAFSVSREVLHDASVNVMCVPVTAQFDPREAHIPDFRRVLVATDFSELGNTAVPYGFAVCAIGGLVKLVHVVAPGEAKGRDPIAWHADLRLQLRELIPDESGARGQPPEVQVLQDDDVAKAICEEAERFGADVLCLASHGFGASRALHGSVAKAVLNRSRRPVLIVRRPE